MPRIARSLEPGKLYHVISRFIDGRFELDDPLRAIVMERCGRVFARSDWTLLTYGLMSSHMHWAVLAGESPSSEWTRPLNGAIAQAIQAARRRRGKALGAVFAERPREIVVEDNAAGLFAYIHNNPVRAGVVESAEQSRWTGHRAMIGVGAGGDPANVRCALEIAGFGTDSSGRSAFHQFVLARAEDRSFGFQKIELVRNVARATAHVPVELRGPRIRMAAGEVEYEVVVRSETRRRPPMHVDASSVVEAAAHRLRVPVELACSRSRTRPAVASRRLALLAGRLSGLRLTQVAAVLGMSLSAASELVSTIDADHPAYAEARSVLEQLARR